MERWLLTPKGSDVRSEMTTIQIDDPVAHKFYNCFVRQKVEWFGCGCSHRHALALAYASEGGKGKGWVPLSAQATQERGR